MAAPLRREALAALHFLEVARRWSQHDRIGPRAAHRLETSVGQAQVIEGMTRVLGRAIWNSTVIGLTHGRLTSLPGNMPYGEPALHCAQAQRRPTQRGLSELAPGVVFMSTKEGVARCSCSSCEKVIFQGGKLTYRDQASQPR